MGIQDNYLTMGKEAVAYGTAAATLTRAFEVQSDDHKAVAEPMESRGMRLGAVSQPVTSYVQRFRGATGTIPVDLRSKGMGFFFEGAAGTYAVTTPGGATDARLHTATPTTAGPSTSYTTKFHRYDMGGTGRYFQYAGGSVSELKIAQEAKQYTKLTPSMIYKAVADSTAAGGSITASTPAYPGGTVFDSDNCTVTLGGDDICTRTFDITLPTGLERRDLVGCVPQPKVKGRVAPSGNLTLDFNDMDVYELYRDGTPTDLVIAWTGALIEGSTYESVTLTMENIVFTSDTPETSLDDYPTQPGAFMMLTDPGVAPPWKVEIVTTDTAV